MTKQVEEFLVLTAAPRSEYFDDARLAEMNLPTPRRLSGDAIECALPPNSTDFVATLRQKFGDAPFDINHVCEAERRKKMLIADLESTIIEQECLDELAKTIGKQEEMASITTRAMRGELDFEPALKERVAMLKGIQDAALGDLYDNITLMSGADVLIATLRANGVFCGLVSGGFAFFAHRISDRLGFDRFQCNDLDITDGVLDGTIIEPILDRAAKAQILTAWAKEMNLTDTDVMATGDGSNDLDMLARAGMGVAFRAKPAVEKAARYRIQHGDLTALLYLQGYDETDLVV